MGLKASRPCLKSEKNVSEVAVIEATTEAGEDPVAQENPELAYIRLNHYYFMYLPCPSTVSAKEHFENTLKLLLKRIRKKDDYADFSEEFFIQSEKGEIKDQLEKENAFSPQLQEWSWAIYYCYHKQTLPEYHRRENIVVNMAILFSFLKKYAALEEIFEKHRALFAKHNGAYDDPLTFYAASGHFQKVKILLEKDHSEEVLGNAFYWSAYTGRLLVLKYLWDKVGDKIPLEFKKSALLSAINNGYSQLVDYLLYSIDIETLKEAASKAVYEAAQKGELSILKHLLQHEHINAEDISEEDANNALLFSAKSAKAEKTSEMVALLLRYTGKRITPQYIGSSLCWAIRRKHAEVEKILCDHIVKLSGSAKSVVRIEMSYSNNPDVHAFLSKNFNLFVSSIGSPIFPYRARTSASFPLKNIGKTEEDSEVRSPSPAPFP